jgi:hypothetical protein
MMNEMGESFNVDAVKDYIRKNRYRVFALCSDRSCYFICPIRRKCVYLDQRGAKGYVTYRYGAIYDNVDKFGNEIFSKEEMCTRFLLNFGYEVKYRYDAEKNGLTKL